MNTNGAATPTQTPHNPEGYRFQPLEGTLKDAAKTPLVLINTGSFSPITMLHLRLFELARDHCKENNFEFLGGYLSPVNDNYHKVGLRPAHHRVKMCQAAVSLEDDILVDAWEAMADTYQPTAHVLDHFDYEINIKRGGVADANGRRHKVKIMLVAGSDLVQTMSIPNVWSEADLDHILGKYGLMAVSRAGSDVDSFLALEKWASNIFWIENPIQEHLSSTKVRNLLKHGNSVKYLIPRDVQKYIEEHGLYSNDGSIYSG